MKQNEVWKDIIGHEGYKVSNLGRVKSFKSNKGTTEHILNPGLGGNGYLTVNLYNGSAKTRTIHRLVAIHFIPNPENKPEVNHKKGIKIDNRATELEWVTHKENSIHSFKIGIQISSQLGRGGKDHHLSKPVSQYSKDGKLIAEYDYQSEASKQTGINNVSISLACRGKIKTAGKYIWKSKKLKP